MAHSHLRRRCHSEHLYYLRLFHNPYQVFPRDEVFHIHREENFIGSPKTTLHSSGHVSHPFQGCLRAGKMNSTIILLLLSLKRSLRVMWLTDSCPSIHISGSDRYCRTSSIEWLVDPEFLDVVHQIGPDSLSEESLQIGKDGLFPFFLRHVGEFLSNEANQSRNSFRITGVVDLQ